MLVPCLLWPHLAWWTAAMKQNLPSGRNGLPKNHLQHVLAWIRHSLPFLVSNVHAHRSSLVPQHPPALPSIQRCGCMPTSHGL